MVLQGVPVTLSPVQSTTTSFDRIRIGEELCRAFTERKQYWIYGDAGYVPSALLRRFCYTRKTPVKIQLIKTFVLPIIQVAASSRLLANPLIGECLEHAQKLRKGYLAAQWSSLDHIITIAHVFILGVKVYPSLAMAVTAIELASTRAVELTIQSIKVQLPLMAEDNAVVFSKTVVEQLSWCDESSSNF